MSCGVGRRPGLDPALHSYAVTVCRPATVAPIRTLAWELPYAMGETLKSKSKKKKKKDGGPVLIKLTFLGSSVWHSRVGIRHCRSCGSGCNGSTTSAPGLGTSTATGMAKKNPMILVRQEAGRKAVHSYANKWDDFRCGYDERLT